MRNMRQRKTRNLGLALTLAVAMVPLLGTAAMGATSGTTTVTANVNAGALAITGPATASVTVTLNGLDQTPTYTLALVGKDETGSGTGWNLTITSTTFTTGAPVHTLSTTASSLTGVTSACAQGTCTNPTNAITYPVGVPAGATAPVAVKFFNSAANTGMGDFNVTPTIGVTIPANAFAGTYTSTVTTAIVSAP